MNTPESNEPAILFQEEQQFRQPVLWVILIFSSAMVMGTVFWMWLRQLIQGESFAPDSLSNVTLLFFGSLIVLSDGLVIAFFLLARLQTEVTTEGFFLRFFPLQWKVRQVDLTGVERVERTTFQAFLEYGGFGIRRVGKSKSYIIHANEGVKIFWDNGMHLLVSSKYPDELFDALKIVLAGQEYQE